MDVAKVKVKYHDGFFERGASLLAHIKIVGRFQGSMEIGPGRSVIGVYSQPNVYGYER
ncbi:hypothetical protein [Tamlana flava]|uniref:hypothetical protein n=1 Tax=Tamlana flava TaxID=3158572 RepID=UPI00351BD6F1